MMSRVMGHQVGWRVMGHQVRWGVMGHQVRWRFLKGNNPPDLEMTTMLTLWLGSLTLNKVDSRDAKFDLLKGELYGNLVSDF